MKNLKNAYVYVMEHLDNGQWMVDLINDAANIYSASYKEYNDIYKKLCDMFHV